MAANKIDARQSKLAAAQAMLGSAANDTLDTIFPKINDELAKLFEDRNLQITDGGLISFLGTSVQFTQSLKIHLNSKVAGGSPVIIDLGSTTRTISADGRMIYAVINRTAGTATVTDDSATLPAITSSNQEVFLIAKRVDSPDGVKRLYFRNGSAFNEGQSARLGSAGSGTGSGSGVGDDLDALTFKASITDTFAELSTDTTTTIDYGSNKTDATLLSVVNQYIRLNYDAAKTVTAGTTTTNLNISASAAFTVKVGDFAIYGTDVKRITAVASQSSFTTEAFTTAPTLAGQVTISQGVYTKDLNNYSGDGYPISTAFSTNISQILMSYEDTTTVNDIIFDANAAPVIGYSASSDGTTYSSLTNRATNLSDTQSMLNLPTSGTNLYVRFVVNKTSGFGAVNLLNYKTFFHRDATFTDGSVLNQAYGRLDGIGTKVNIAVIANVSGKTRVQLSWSYPVGVNSGTANGSIKVYLNGQKVPRYVDATTTADAYYKEIDQNTIELDQDYTSLALAIEIVQDVAVVDASDTNTTAVAQIQEATGEGFQAFVKSSQVINATTTTGTPATGTFYSTVVNRASIIDLSQDLKVRMGVERIMTQQIYQLQNEFGSSGEPVWATPNDFFNQIRCVGNWAQTVPNNGQHGPFIQGNSLNDFIEITFYGTGLNWLTFPNSSAGTDIRASVDGGTEGANLFVLQSSVLQNRIYSPNVIVPVVAGLTLGTHTVKLRLAAVANSLNVFGFEVLNEASTLKINPGSSYINNKKITTNTQQSPSYNSSFESGTLGTRGGRVLVYQKSDGTIAKAVQPAGSQLNLTSADHTSEEVSRIYSVREFGAGRADDFSIATAAGSYAFTLDDGTTTLSGAAVVPNTLFSGRTGVGYSTSGFLILTFIGTGLDINCNSTSANTIVTLVDGASVGNITTLTTGYRTYKVVSGLPYGTHTVKLTIATAANITINEFIVYQPKKPTLPSGAVELADYNVIADYTGTTTVTGSGVCTGVLRKCLAVREAQFVGTWAIGGVQAATFESGINNSSVVANSYVSYSFFGTGFELGFLTANGVNNATFTVDGAVNTNVTMVQGGTGVVYTPATGVLSGTSSNNYVKLKLSGLTLGVHTIKFLANSTNVIYADVIDIITPIHSAKSNIYIDTQNTLPVGSQGISDNRKTSAIKEASAQTKNIAQAVGISVSPTTTSTTAVPLSDMSVVHFNRTGRIKISYSASLTTSASGGQSAFLQAFVDGSAVGTEKLLQVATANVHSPVSDSFYVNVSPGVHKIDVYWYTSAGTSTSNGVRRNLLVEEV